MNIHTKWQRTAISLAMITVGTGCFVAQQLQGRPKSAAGDRERESAVIMVYASEQAAGMASFENAKVETRALTGPLSDEIKHWSEAASGPEWLGYMVPAANGERIICCGGNGDWNGYRDCGPCRLEDRQHGNTFSSGQGKTQLERPGKIAVLYRAAEKRIDKIRVVSDVCTVDAGGLRVTWLTGVDPAQSADFLSTFVRGQNLDDHGRENPSQGALTAIAMHGDAAADLAMGSFVGANQPESLRKQTVFWLGEARGEAGLQTLKNLEKKEPSTEVRAQIAFALSLNRAAGSLDELIHLAKQDESTHVRSQALFWLAQKAGQKAESAITGAIENDPDTEVKKKAVFALSQLPQEEGVPKLIQVAQNNRNPEVRKQAMFWLGQSNDPRALDFFEKILSK
jgi:hypothetical protein